VRDEGHAEGLREAVRDLCAVLGIELSAQREESLGTMHLTDLIAMREHLKRDRRWP
jgi:hypothetical protein